MKKIFLLAALCLVGCSHINNEDNASIKYSNQHNTLSWDKMFKNIPEKTINNSNVISNLSQ